MVLYGTIDTIKYLGAWETNLLDASPLKPFIYLRYIDDVFGIWLHGEETLKEFHLLANSLHEQIKLDLRFSSENIEFLDVQVKVNGDSLVTDVYTKPTDSKAYLHFSSDHPLHVKKAIPSGLAMRARRICSSDRDFLHQVKDINKNLSDRGYPSALVNHELDRVKCMERGSLLEGVGKKEKQGVPLVVTYSRHLPNINKILKEKNIS